MNLFLLGRLVVLFLERLSFCVFLLLAEQFQLFARLFLHLCFFSSFLLQNAFQVLGLIIIESDMQFVAGGLLECFLFGVLHQPDMLAEEPGTVVDAVSPLFACSTSKRLLPSMTCCANAESARMRAVRNFRAAPRRLNFELASSD